MRAPTACLRVAAPGPIATNSLDAAGDGCHRARLDELTTFKPATFRQPNRAAFVSPQTRYVAKRGGADAEGPIGPAGGSHQATALLVLLK